MKICPGPGTVKPVNRRESEQQLAVLKALGDETRYAMYEELARSTAALSASDLAERLGIHANTVRLHLERLREVGPGRRRGRPPRHRRPSPAPLLPQRRRARPRVRPAGPRAPRRAARRPGRADRRRRRRRRGHRPGLGHRGGRPHPGPQLPRRARRPSSPSSGSSPRSRPTAPTADGAARIEFLHCPFRELAEAYPELVCNLHRGLCEGVVDAVGGGTVDEFATLYDPEPCHVTVGLGSNRSVKLPVVPREPLRGPMFTVQDASTVFTLTDAASRQGEEPDHGRGQPRPRPAGRRASRRLLGLQLRDVLRHRRRRRRRARSSRAASPWSSTRRACRTSAGRRSTSRTASRAPGSRINNPNAQRSCGCGQSFS